MWVLLAVGGLFLLELLLLTGVAVVFIVTVAGGDILPGVHAGGVALGGKSETEATTILRSEWQTIVLKDGERTWAVNPAELGITLDAPATAKAAYEEGRFQQFGFGTLQAMLTDVDVAPVVQIDLNRAQNTLTEMSPQMEQPAINAGVRFVNGQVQAVPAVEGRVLDIGGTLSLLQSSGGEVLKDGVLELAMLSIQPPVGDATPMVEEARLLLASQLQINAFDPIKNEIVVWSLPPQEWDDWLVATPDNAGLTLTLDGSQLGAYLSGQSGGLGSGRYLNVEEAVTTIQQHIARRDLAPVIRVYHRDALHTVQAGETFSSIAWDYGIPYPWIQQANPSVPDALSAGQTLTIPSPDSFVPLPVVASKRIILNMSQQRLWAYENGQVKWEWIISTGIATSPTWPGVYQIQSHEPNAYAANWNLWMPYFMGVYRPVPSSEFMNGFHGFPTRDNSQLLWTNSLGTRVTYGCILLSNENAELLYNWAQEGVVVEIQR